MDHLPQLNLAATGGGGARTRSNSTTTTTTTTSTTSSLPSSSGGWIPHILKKTCIVQQDFRMEENHAQMSIVFSALPTSIQSRLPPIPSLRRKMTGRPAVAPVVTSSSSSSPASTVASTSPTTKSPVGLLRSPFSSGRTTPVSDAETAVMDISESSDGETDQQGTEFDGFAFSDARNLASSMSMLPSPATSDTGINWRCGAQGFGLVINSAQESRCRRSTNYNSCFERTSYIDGVQYMLQGLPRDLDPTEAAILRRSMPPALSESLSYHHHSHQDGNLSDPYNSKSSSLSADGEDRNLIHSLLLFVLIYLKNWILWVMPYILLLSGEVIHFEREHNLAGIVVNKCVAGATAGLAAIKAMSDGPLGQCLGSVLEYMAEGVSGALQEFARDWFALKKETEFGGSAAYMKGGPGKSAGIDGCGGYGGGYGRQQQQQQQRGSGRTRMR